VGPDQSRVDETTDSVQLTAERYSIFRIFSYFLGAAIVVVAMWVPLHAVRPMVEAIAGRETSFTAAVSVSLVLSISLVVTLAGTMIRSRTKSAKIEEQRARIKTLEDQVTRLEAQLPKRRASGGRRQ
jgi:multidrug efflux pump subunit AcrB